MVICFNGIDGSGKSLQVRLLVDRLNASGYPASDVWVGGRSTLTAPLIWLGKQVLGAPRSRKAHAPAPAEAAQYRTYLSGTERLFRQRLVREAWLRASLVEHAGEMLKELIPELARGRIVVCDRFIYDTIVGVAVLSGTSLDELDGVVRMAVMLPLPRPSAWFLLDLPAEVAFQRKNDIPDKLFLERRVPLYRAMARRFGVRTLDATQPPDVIAESVWQHVEPLLEQRGSALNQAKTMGRAS